MNIPFTNKPLPPGVPAPAIARALDTAQLRMLLRFYSFARLGSYGKAANLLGRDAANIYSSVRSLADAIGAPLVQPGPKRGRVELTPAGRRLADALEPLWPQIAKALATAAEPQNCPT